jgi:hypothetical protein
MERHFGESRSQRWSRRSRIEFTEMISAALERMPDYEIAPDPIEEYPNWAMNAGWRRVPATFTPGKRVLA